MHIHTFTLVTGHTDVRCVEEDFVNRLISGIINNSIQGNFNHRKRNFLRQVHEKSSKLLFLATDA